jgi:NitT/TauT family transport system substrate-binding protein
MKRNIVVLCAATAVLVTASTGGRAQEVVRIGLAVPNNAAYTPFYAAEALGYYKDAGLKAELTIYRGGAASQEALSAGAADMITYFAAGAGLAISKGAKEKVVAAIDGQPHGWHYLVLANSPIKSLKDLDGKKVGVATKAGTADMFALWGADKAGVKITTIPVGGGGMVPALKGAQVDAIAMFPGLSLQLLATGEARSIVDLGKEMEPTLPDVIVASQEFIDKKPEVVRGTLNAFFKAVAHLCGDRKWGLQFLKEFTKEKDDKVNELTYDSVLCQQSRDGAIRPEWVANSLNIAAKVWGLGELQKIKPEDVYTDKFIPAVAK